MNKTKKSNLENNSQQQKQLTKKANGSDDTVPVGKKKEKEKRRNNEKRKEKSRDAARTRRSRETEIFNELAAAVPMRAEDIEHLDKASVMRLAIAFLKSRGMIELFPQLIGDNNDVDRKMATLNEENATLKSLDGFLLVLSTDGDITYVSENIADFLGLSQIDLLGQPIWDYCHQCDHDELREALIGRKTSPSELLNGGTKGDCAPMVKRDFFLRLKCTLTSRGRSVNIKSASYKVIHITGHMVTGEDKIQMLAIGQPLPHPSNIEVPLGATTFLTKHALDMKFSYVDDKMLSLLGYKADHLIGKSLYDFHHGADSESLMATFKGLISKGQTETSRYRFLARTGGYAWLVTQATIVYEKQKPQSVVCINYIISGVENKDEIYSCAQLAAQQTEHQPHRKQQQQQQQPVDDIVKKEIVKSDEQLSIEVFESPVLVKSRPSPVLKPALISPPIISGVPISNTNIHRPRSVTAAIFASAQVEKPVPSVQQQQQHHPPPIRGQSVTAKLFAASPSLSSLTAAAGQHQQARPQNATSKIFVPRTEDMNKGYYMYCEEDTGLTMLKDEPDDLTHLAPTAGDACISIDETPPFFPDMFDDFMIPDHYNTLLSDEINTLDNSASAGIKNNKKILINQNNNKHNNNNNNNSTSNNNNNNSTTINNNNQNSITTTNNNDNYRCSSASSNTSNSSKSSSENSNGSSDPFINYRDESSDINNSSHLLPPGLAKSPEGSTSLPSLCSPNSSLPEDDFAFMTLSMDEDMDLSMRAPYIPMSEADDLPLLISDDLMWGAQPDEIKEAISQIKMNTGKTSGPTKCSGVEAKSINFNGGKTLDHSSLAALLSGSSTFNQQPIKTTVNSSTGAHNLLMQQQQHLVAEVSSQQQQQEIQVHHIQIQQQAPILHQQQLQDLIDDIKPKMGAMVDKLSADSRMGGNNGSGCIDPLILLGQAYKNNQLNQMEHNWTMNDLLQLNLNNNDSMNHQQQPPPPQQQHHTPQVSPISIKLERPVATNKRPANIFTLDSSAAKRLKSTLSVSSSPPAAVVPNLTLNEPKMSPNLLQQLMAPLTPAQRAKLKTRTTTNDTGRWNRNNNGATNGANKDQQQQSQNGGHHQPSNSVLMNLLVSGCDETISLEPPELVMHDDISRDSIHDHCLPPSPMDSSDTNHVLLHHDNSNHFLANPMIGGVNFNTVSPTLLSPTDMERPRNHNNTESVDRRTARITAVAEVDNLLMELNEQEYNMDMGNDLLAALDINITAPSPTAMLT